MFNIVLMQPEIPANTGNIARSCAATGSTLHLVGPLGFDISDSAVKRAGLDYWHLVDVRSYPSSGDFWCANKDAFRAGARCFYASTKAPSSYAEVSYEPGDWLFFGRETQGLPETLLLSQLDRCVRIPIRAEARSLNLSNSVAIVLFEAMRQNGFAGMENEGRFARL